MLSGKRILVTGASGFVGGHVTKAFEAEGASVVPADRRHGVDLTRRGALDGLPTCDLLLHLAATTFVPRSYEDPAGTYRVNVGGTVEACEKARADGAPLILASSYVYGEPERLPVDETHPVRPANPYAHSKVLAEGVVSGYHEHFGLRAVAARSFNLYGPGQKPPFLIPAILEQLAAGRVALEDPDPKRDFLHVEDLAAFYVAAAEHVLGAEAPLFEVFNVGSGVSHSVAEVAERMVEAWGGSVALSFKGKVREGDVSNVVADASKAKRVLGWSAGVPFEAGIVRLVHAERKPRRSA